VGERVARDAEFTDVGHTVELFRLCPAARSVSPARKTARGPDQVYRFHYEYCGEAATGHAQIKRAHVRLLPERCLNGRGRIRRPAQTSKRASPSSARRTSSRVGAWSSAK